jgi:hypothetical protein
VLEKLQRWLVQRVGSTWATTKPTVVFDKGNNSEENFGLIDKLELPYVGSVKLDEHPDLMEVSNQDARWQAATEPGLEGTKSWQTQQVVYGKERTLVVTYNEHLFASQWATVQNDLAHALSQLAAVRQNLQDRAAGLIRGGTKPTVESVERKCDQILHRQHLRQLVRTTVTQNPAGVPQLAYEADDEKLIEILNAVWLFPADAKLELDQVIAGKLNGQALRYVAAGGGNDQSLYAGGKVEYAVKLPAKAVQEMTFLVACPGSSVPPPDQTTWTLEKLRQAAAAVCRDWK